MSQRPDFSSDPAPHWPDDQSWPPKRPRRSWSSPRHRPSWWPENETWPPRNRFRHNPFFRRLGCLFLSIYLITVAGFAFLIVFIANLLGMVRIPSNLFQSGVPAGILLILLGLAVLGVGGFGVRRISMPLDDLLDAAGRVAEGDYSVKVEEKGPVEVRSLAHAFNDMSSRLHRSDEQRRELLADVTHELRTPLTVIQGNLEGMLDGVYNPDEASLRSLLEEANVLSRLVEDLRTLSLAESGALKLKKDPTDLNLLVCDTLAAFQSQAEAAGVKLVTETANDLPWLDLDPGRMRQVLSNLAANALRYTPQGGSVQASTWLANQRALIEIKDDGPGIPAEELPHVFERFHKSTDAGGMGLGLAIAKHLVEAHGGTIEAECKPGDGTTMRISLPVDKAN